MEPITLIIAMVIAFISAIVGGMIGGAYLILIPALLMLGLDIHHVIGITKILTIAIGLSFINYWRKGKIDLKSNWPYLLVLVVGSVVGSFIVIQINEMVLQTIIGILMVLIVLFLLFNKNFGIKPIKIKIKRRYIALAIVLFFVLGIYDGFYAAASSVFAVMLLTSILKNDFMQSIGNARILDFGAGIASAVVFASKGLIDYKIALPLAIMCIAGSWLGSNITLKKGATFVRYALIVVSIVFAVKLLFFW